MKQEWSVVNGNGRVVGRAMCEENAMTEITPASVIKRYIELRDKKREFARAAASREAEFDQAIETLGKYLHAEMDKRGEVQIKTDVGVAFKTPQRRVSSSDRVAIVRFVLDDVLRRALLALEKYDDFFFPDAEGFDTAIGDVLDTMDEGTLSIFTNHVSKEYVESWMAVHGNSPPPGIDVKEFIAVQVRKA